jgi:hypothetical protein
MSKKEEHVFPGLKEAITTGYRHKVEEVIPIDPDSRYVVVVSAPNLNDLNESVHHLRDILQKWWESKDSKFLVLGKTGNAEIRFEKIDKAE